MGFKFVTGLFLALLVGACGGKAVLDAEGGLGDGGSAGDARLLPTITAANFRSDCIPGAPPTALIGVVSITWTSSIQGQSASAVVQSVSLGGIVGDVGVSIDVRVDSPVFETSTSTDVQMSGRSETGACAFCDGANLVLSYESAGETETITFDADTSCVF